MRILLVFLDMFRVNLTNTYNENNERTLFDDSISKIGGSLYMNCYTPGPDTPRSNGCLWSSSYPKKNGCNNRLKYPKYYLKKRDFLGILKRNGYDLNFYINPYTKEVGELPNSIEDCSYFSDGLSLDSFFNHARLSDNSLTYLSFGDFHYVISDTYAQKKYVKKAYDLSGKIIDGVNSIVNYDLFDLVIFYSDHGFKMREENLDTDLKMLGDSRTQILLFIHRRGDNSIDKQYRLSSIMDIYPTILDFCSIEFDQNEIDGLSLFSDNEHEFIMIEDHRTFGVDLGQTIERWGFKTNDYLIAVNPNLDWQIDNKNTTINYDEYYQYLLVHGTDFESNVKMKMIHNKYDDSLSESSFYFDGKQRVIHKPFVIFIVDSWKKTINCLSNIYRKLLYKKH